MTLGSHYRSSARKQLVRPFLSSPITLFAYLLLVLSGVGLLEWVLRASASAQVKRDLEGRAIWLDQYYSQVELLPKHTVPSTPSATRSVGLLRRQSGNLEPTPTASDLPSGAPSGSGSGSGFSSDTPSYSPSSVVPTPRLSSSTTTIPSFSATTPSVVPPFTTTTTSVPPPTTSSIGSTETTTTASAPLAKTTTTTPSQSPTPVTPSSLSPTTPIPSPKTTTSTMPAPPPLTTTITSIPSSTTSSSGSKGTTTPVPAPLEATTTSLPSPTSIPPLSSSTVPPNLSSLTPTAITSAPPASTTTTRSVLSSSTSSLGTKGTTIATTTIMTTLAPITSTATTKSPVSGPDNSSTATSTVTSAASSSTSLSSISQPTTPSISNLVSITTTSGDRSLISDSQSASSANRVQTFSSATSAPSLSSSPPTNSGVVSRPSPTFSSSETAVRNTADSSTIVTSEQRISTTSPRGSTAVFVVATSSSMADSSTQQRLVSQSTSLTAFSSPSSIASIADMASTILSRSTIAASISPTKVSSIDESIPTSTALATSTCRHGFTCLFANQKSAVPLRDGHRTLPVPVDVTADFAANFASMIIILLFQSFWLIIYASIRLNEPFHQLAQPRRTPLETGLLFEFLVVGFPLDHFRAGFRGNWTSWYMVTAYMVLLIMMTAPSLAAEAFSVQNIKVYCGKGSGSNNCVQRVWTVAPGPVRALQMLLILAALLVFIVLVARVYRGSALSLKKVNLALVATTLSDSHTAGLLHDINPDAPQEETTPFLQTQSWALEPSVATEIGTEHGSYVLRSRPERNTAAQHISSAYAEQSSRSQGLPRPLMNLLIPVFIILFLAILITVYTVNGPDNSRLTFFFASVSFGPKFFLVSMCTILGIALGRVENEVRILTPYRSLHGTRSPQPLLMRRLHPSALTQAFAAFKHGEWVSAFVSFMAGYGVNVLAMTASNIPYHPGRSVPVTIGCIFASLALLILMAVALVAVAVWRRGNSSLELQKWPTTLADIYILMVHSRVPGVQGTDERNPDVIDFYGDAHGKKPIIIQRTVEIKELDRSNDDLCR